MGDDAKIAVLFVCMGNICRSPLAEGMFEHLARERGVLDRFRIDSCGTGGWHTGERADRRMRATAEQRGVELTSRARQIDPAYDFPNGNGDGFAHILVMDRQNHIEVLELGAPPERVALLRSFDPTAGETAEVPDPYYGGQRGFDDVYDMVERACTGLLDALLDT
ncbi:MAG: low molecular weight protein-tyrosine-phosphatase [Planctomycetota bacterium]